jgi:hypothetical protein
MARFIEMRSKATSAPAPAATSPAQMTVDPTVYRAATAKVSPTVSSSAFLLKISIWGLLVVVGKSYYTTGNFCEEKFYETFPL